MDMHDTLYLDPRDAAAASGGRVLLRTHTSPVQVRVMREGPPPHRVVIPGIVYRNDPFDPSHAPAFTQLEGLAVDVWIVVSGTTGTMIPACYHTGAGRVRISHARCFLAPGKRDTPPCSGRCLARIGCVGLSRWVWISYWNRNHENWVPPAGRS